MLRSSFSRSLRTIQTRLNQMALHVGAQNSAAEGLTLAEIPKSNNFTSKLPPDPAFETPEASHSVSREHLGPRLVKGALYTYVRPEKPEDPELLGVSPKALEDLGLKLEEAQNPELKEIVSGNRFFWSEEKGGVYPWAQCYGGAFDFCARMESVY